MSSKTHKALVLQHLMEGKKITPIGALNLFGCFRLGARIYDSRSDGYDIRTTSPEGGKQYAIYYMTEDAIQKAKKIKGVAEKEQ